MLLWQLFDNPGVRGSVKGGHELVAEVFVPGPKAPLNEPYGGQLVNVMASPERAEEVCVRTVGRDTLACLHHILSRAHICHSSPGDRIAQYT